MSGYNPRIPFMLSVESIQYEPLKQDSRKPRGMEFLYDLNRFNVATSRARCACIVVGSPRLFSPECRTPRQMELANVLCRYAEMSESVEFGTQTALGDAH
jgi:hypothetical protein